MQGRRSRQRRMLSGAAASRSAGARGGRDSASWTNEGPSSSSLEAEAAEEAMRAEAAALRRAAMETALELRQRLRVPAGAYESVWYDGVQQHFVLRRGAAYHSVGCVGGRAAARVSPGVLLPHEAARAQYARFSLDGCYLAVQVGAAEVHVFDVSAARDGGGRATQQWRIDVRSLGQSALSKLKSQSGGAAMAPPVLLTDGVLWSDHGGTSQDLVLVTRRGLEFFKVNAKKNSCKHYRSIYNATSAFWFSPTSRLVLLSTGPTGTRMCGYFLPFDTSDMPKLEIPPPHSAPIFDLGLHGAPSLQAREVGLVTLYNYDYCLQLLPGGGKADNPVAYLYRVERERITLTHVLALHTALHWGAPGSGTAPFPGGGQSGGQSGQAPSPSLFRAGMTHSVVDNLLVLHSGGMRESVAFDIAASESSTQGGATDEYLTLALREQRRPRAGYPRKMGPIFEAQPLVMLPEAVPFPDAGTGSDEDEKSAPMFPPGPYTGSWPLHAPCWVSRPVGAGSNGGGGGSPPAGASSALDVFEIRLRPEPLLRRPGMILEDDEDGEPEQEHKLEPETRLMRILLRRGMPAPAPLTASRTQLQRVRAVGRVGCGWRLVAPNSAASTQRRPKALLEALAPRQALMAPFDVMLGVKAAVLEKIRRLVEEAAPIRDLGIIFRSLAAVEVSAVTSSGVVVYGLQKLGPAASPGKKREGAAEMRRRSAQESMESSAPGAAAAAGATKPQRRATDVDGRKSEQELNEHAYLTDFLEHANFGERELRVLGVADETVAFVAPWVLTKKTGMGMDRSSLIRSVVQLLGAARGGAYDTALGTNEDGWGVGAGSFRRREVPSRLPLRNLRATDGRLVIFHMEILFHVLLPVAVQAVKRLVASRRRSSHGPSSGDGDDAAGANGGGADAATDDGGGMEGPVLDLEEDDVTSTGGGATPLEELEYVVEACRELCAVQTAAYAAVDFVRPDHGGAGLSRGKSPSPAVLALAGECLLVAGRGEAFVQLFRWGVSEDSLALAAYLLQRGDVGGGQMRELAIDMLERIGEVGPLVHALLSVGRLRRAMEVARRIPEIMKLGAPIRELPATPGDWFRATAVRAALIPAEKEAERAAIFYTLYVFLEGWDKTLLEAPIGKSLSKLAQSFGKPFPMELFSTMTASTLIPLFGFPIDDMVAKPPR
uniref:Mic1 domain-containing protein n=1 Tax=Phaeomonas parva TaxID=124430 RepID=A0A7S1TX98_9STRA|mmetsp:Transcript_21241/g.64684  ORF Transcript_21241/g.64684 Transcript_21241/m.64684 type:complete len:1169 (+) Transcript_21241:137-3643(+)